jgi:hypothetical protein
MSIFKQTSPRFEFPALNMNAPLEAQMISRAHWVGYRLMRSDTDEKGPFWKLQKKISREQVREFVCSSLCEVDLILSMLLDEIGQRIRKEEAARMNAERVVMREFQTSIGATIPNEQANDAHARRT